MAKLSRFLNAKAIPNALSIRRASRLNTLPKRPFQSNCGRRKDIFLISTKFLLVLIALEWTCNLWAQSWISTNPMNTQRVDYKATLLSNGNVLVCGGTNLIQLFGTCELFNPVTGSWTFTGSMITPRRVFGMVRLPDGRVLTVGGNIYCAGGYDCPTNLAEIYDPNTGQWSPVSAMMEKRVSFGMVVLNNGKVLVAGGTDDLGYKATAEIYDVTTNNWVYTGQLRNFRGAFGMALLGDGTVLVAGGANGYTFLSAAERFNPGTGLWSDTGQMIQQGTGFGFVVLSSSTSQTRVLKIGGNGPYRYQSFCEIYDSVTGNWTATGSLQNGRESFGVAKLPTGNVLVAGGSISPYGWRVNLTEEYIVSSGSWISRPSMITVRSNFTMVNVSYDGTVLAIGGNDLNGNALSAVEKYIP